MQIPPSGVRGPTVRRASHCEITQTAEPSHRPLDPTPAIIPSRGRIPRPPAPPAGALFEFNSQNEDPLLTLLCLHNGGGLGYHARGAEFYNDSFQG